MRKKFFLMVVSLESFLFHQPFLLFQISFASFFFLTVAKLPLALTTLKGKMISYKSITVPAPLKELHVNNRTILTIREIQQNYHLSSS